jgi:glycosyltransferase involved in cell wall biosynthesis
MTTAMAGRPSILVLVQCLPYPPQSGVRSRTFNILKELQRDFDVTVVPFSRHNHQPSASDRDTARRMLRQVVTDVGVPVPIPGEQSQARRAWDHLRSVLTRRAYTYYEYQSRDFRQQLRETVRRRPFHLVHLDSIDLHGALEELPRVTVACTHHDIEPLLLRLRASRTPGLLGRYIQHQADLVERLIRVVCPRLDLNVMMSGLDAERLQTLAPGSKTFVAPNGVDADYFRPMPYVPLVAGRIVFLGPTYQFANRDAVGYLLEEVFPRVRARCRTASLTLVGGHSDSDRTRYASEPGVTCAGHVADVRPYLAEAACCVVPIRVGGGTRLKILDAWAMGKAVVSTSAGCEGLHAVDGENILIRDTPQAFADAVLTLADDCVLRSRLGSRARDTVEETYAWSRIGSELRGAYRQLMQH